MRQSTEISKGAGVTKQNGVVTVASRTQEQASF
jgi:hypothetical protein